MRITLYTYDRKKDQNITAGTINDNVFYRKITPKHFVRKYQGYAIQQDVFKRLRPYKCNDIVFVKGKTQLKSSLVQWEQFGITDDLGHGLQVFLPEKYMEVIK